jgi:FkbM family methyltransferase
MKKNIKKLIRSIIPQKVKNIIVEDTVNAIHNNYQKKLEFRNISYSQEGEDMFLDRVFAQRKEGFYIDVGAHHPKRFSNTYIFYLRGWRGINIDAMPDSMLPFKSLRPEDINLEVGVSNQNEDVLKYYIFNEPALNTFSEEVAKEKDGLYTYKVTNVVEVPVKKLEVILNEHVLPHQKIDFMNIDVEGLDLQVLESNNWTKYRPYIILIEASHLFNIEEYLTSEIAIFLQAQSYTFIGKTYKTLFFKDAKV